MVYERPIIRMTVGGDVLQEDIWSNGLTIGNLANEASARTLFEGLDPADFAPIVNEFYVTSQSSMNGYNRLTYIKLALIGTDGKYLADPKIYDYPVPLAGQGAFEASPQDTIVVSLLTAAKRGLARRGRIYLPAGFGLPSAQTGRLPQLYIDRLLNQTNTYLTKINTLLANSAYVEGFIAIASSQRQGEERRVTAVEVGNLVDNQSRRRNRISEQYKEIELG